MNKKTLKKLKEISNEFNEVIQNFERKVSSSPEDLKLWLYSKHEEIGELFTKE